MHSLPHYALLGSLIAGAAGALVLSIVTISYGLRRRETSDPARGQRFLRVADAAALLCFAVAAGLGTVGLVHHTRAVPAALAAPDEGALTERLQALEKRLASAELELQARTGVSASEWRAWEERIARLETQVGAMEQRVAAATHREDPRHLAPPPVVRKTEPPVRAKPVAAPPASALPSALPALAPKAAAPLETPAAAPTVSAPIVAPPPPAPREMLPSREAPPRVVEPQARVEPSARMEPPVRMEPSVRPEPPTRTESPARMEPPARVEPPRASIESAAPAERPADDTSLGAKLNRDWDEIKRQARRSGREVREGWDRVKRLFSD